MRGSVALQRRIILVSLVFLAAHILSNGNYGSICLNRFNFLTLLLVKSQWTSTHDFGRGWCYPWITMWFSGTHLFYIYAWKYNRECIQRYQLVLGEELMWSVNWSVMHMMKWWSEWSVIAVYLIHLKSSYCPVNPVSTHEKRQGGPLAKKTPS